MTVKRSDFKSMSWNEFGRRVDFMYEKISAYLGEQDLQIDALVPILREGGFLALPLAYKFNTWKIIPIQFKYRLGERETNEGMVPEQKFKLPELLYSLPEKPTLLITDVLPSTVTTGKLVAQVLRKKYPQATIIYASMFGRPDVRKPEEIDHLITGYYYEDSPSLSVTEKELIDPVLWLMPWENLEEEYASICCERYKYT